MREVERIEADRARLQRAPRRQVAQALADVPLLCPPEDLGPVEEEGDREVLRVADALALEADRRAPPREPQGRSEEEVGVQGPRAHVEGVAERVLVRSEREVDVGPAT